MNKQCPFCGKETGLERHHMIHGTANRRLCEEDGLTVMLCHDCHQGTFGVHGREGKAKDSLLKKTAQTIYEETHSRDEWLARYRRNYIE